MGLSSSQARLLNLTGRMHQIEYKAAKLEAEKLQMANKSRRVYDEYQQALEKTKIQFMTLTSNGSINYTDATFANLVSNSLENKKYDLLDATTGDKFIPDDIQAAFEKCNNNLDKFLDLFGIDNRQYTLISSAEELIALNGKTLTTNYKLAADITINGSNMEEVNIADWQGIDLNGYVCNDWQGINLNGCSFDGNGHKITLNSTEVGLFNDVENSDVKNLDLEVNIIEKGYELDEYGERYIPSILGVLTNKSDNSNYVNCEISVSSDCQPAEIYGIGGHDPVTNSTISNVRFCMWNVGLYSGAIYGNNNIIDHCLLQMWESVNVSYLYRNNNFTISPLVGSDNEITDCNSFVDGVIYYTDPYTKQDIGCNITYYAITDCPDGDNIISGCYDHYGYTYMAIDGNTVENTRTTPNDITYKKPETDYTDEELERFFNIMSGGSEIFTNLVNSGEVILVKLDKKDDGTVEMIDTSVAVDTGLQEVADESGLRKAEAKYEADMRQIDMKDRKYDYDLAALDNERNAIKQEMETLKTVARDNVDRTFKLFG